MRKPRTVLFGCILGGSLLGQATAEPVKTDTELQQALLPKEARDLPVRDSAAPLRLTLEQVIKQVLSRSPSAQSAPRSTPSMCWACSPAPGACCSG